MLLQQSDLRVCTRTGSARRCPGLKDRLPQGSFSFLQHFWPFWWGALEGGGHLCQGGGLACAPCSGSRSVIPSAMGAETKHPVSQSLSLLLCCPCSYNPVT